MANDDDDDDVIIIIIITHISVLSVACWSCGRALDLRLTGRGFKSQPVRFHVTLALASLWGC